jgi:hypothetical protein
MLKINMPIVQRVERPLLEVLAAQGADWILSAHDSRHAKLWEIVTRIRVANLALAIEGKPHRERIRDYEESIGAIEQELKELHLPGVNLG